MRAYFFVVRKEKGKQECPEQMAFHELNFPFDDTSLHGKQIDALLGTRFSLVLPIKCTVDYGTIKSFVGSTVVYY